MRQVLARRALPWQTAVDADGALAEPGIRIGARAAGVDANGQLRAASVGYTSEIGMRLRLRWAQAVAAWPSPTHTGQHAKRAAPFRA